jgi:hypothetical protein
MNKNIFIELNYTVNFKNRKRGFVFLQLKSGVLKEDGESVLIDGPLRVASRKNLFGRGVRVMDAGRSGERGIIPLSPLLRDRVLIVQAVELAKNR